MQALILAGGSGTRFWPASRRRRPKQLLALDGERSLLQQTVDRLAPLIQPTSVWICTTAILADAIREQLPDVPPEQVLVEPEGRNTAPAIGWSLVCLPKQRRDDVIAVLPADHRVEDSEAFRQALADARDAVEKAGPVMTLGVTPRWAETGYGYLELGEELSSAGPGVRALSRFAEKPDAAVAEEYLASGRHLWNAGIFVFRASRLLEDLRRFEPELGAQLDQIADAPHRTGELYPKLKSISIDYAVMERLGTEGDGAIATLPLDCGWNDLGSWEALREILPADDENNRTRGDVLTLDASDNLVYAEEGTVAIFGVENLVVVRTGDSVLVMPRERSQDVRRVVDLLRERRRDDLL